MITWDTLRDEHTVDADFHQADTGQLPVAEKTGGEDAASRDT